MANVNNAAVNVGVHVAFLLGRNQGLKLLGCMLILYLTF